MVSTYQYSNVSDFEKFTSTDYSVVDAAYTDTIIEAWISSAEKFVNSYCGTTFTSTIPDEITLATNIIAQKLARNKQIEDGHVIKSQNEVKNVNIYDADIKILLDPHRNEYGNERGIWVIKK